MVDRKTYIESSGNHAKHSLMNLDNYYIHATGGILGQTNDENRIIKILEDGKILVNKNKGKNRNYINSPAEYVCLVDTRRHNPYSKSRFLSAFDFFVLYSPCLLFSRDLEIHIPRLSHDKGKGDMVADMEAEVRYKGDLSLDKLQAITFPIHSAYEDLRIGGRTNTSQDRKIRHLEIFKNKIEFIENNFSNIPVLDLYSGRTITSGEVNGHIIYLKGM